MLKTKKIFLILAHVSILVQANFTINIRNKTSNSSIDHVYILIKGINPESSKQCFISFSQGPNSPGTYEDISPTTDSILYNYDITFFKKTTDGYSISLPYLSSGRIYISINNKLVMPIVGSLPNLGIADPNPYDRNEKNYTTLYDKIEFTYLSNGLTYINPTAVDCLALPIAIIQDKIKNGEKVTVTYGIIKPREKVFKGIEKTFKSAADKYTHDQWLGLIIKNSIGTIIRIVAPGRDENFFDKNYLSRSPYSYIDDLWKYYTEHTIKVDCSELRNIVSLSSYEFTGKVEHNILIFKNGNPRENITIEKPTSNNFFLADQGPFRASNGTPKAIIIREICSAWSVGLLPAAEGTVLSKSYFEKNKNTDNFYKHNSLLSCPNTSGPWYNLYARAIHEQSKDIYAWAYDDAIGLDGTNCSNDIYPATLIIGDMKDTIILKQ